MCDAAPNRVTEDAAFSSEIIGSYRLRDSTRPHVTTTFRISALALALTVLSAADAAAQGNSKKSGKPVATVERHGTVVQITDREARIFREYYAGKPKPKPLPPGIAKNLARGKPLPPGIAKTRLPGDLSRRLPARTGYEWVIANDVVTLIDAAGIVRDILYKVF